MKLAKIDTLNLAKSAQKVSFGGYQDDYNNRGEEGIKFYMPPHDSNKYLVSLEYVGLKKYDLKKGDTGFNEKLEGKWVVDEETVSKKELMSDVESIFISKDEPILKASDNRYKADGSKPDKAFGYRYVLTPTDGSKNIYVNDAGVTSTPAADGGAFNAILISTGGIHKTGPMYHVHLDSQVDEKDAKSKVRTHYNMFGGTINDLTKKVTDGTLDNYGLIMPNPLFGDDRISNSLYWSSNAYQIAPRIGDLNDYKKLNIEMFKKGSQLVADGAFTSQGFQSPFLQHALKWGKESPYYDWYKFDYSGKDSNLKLSIGAIPESKEAQNHVTYRIVNNPNTKGGGKNPNYDKTKPTLIQFYDERLLSKEKLEKFNKENRVIDCYDQDADTKAGNDIYDVSNHHDGIYLYNFELNIGDKDRLKKLSENENETLDKITEKIGGYEDLFTFDYFKVVPKTKGQGGTFLDGQFDLIKMNLANPDPTDRNQIGNAQAKNHMFNVATYWTRTVNNTLVELMSIKGSDDVEKLAKENHISKDDFEQIKTAIDKGEYQINLFNKSPKTVEAFISDEIMDFPLESIEVAPDLTAVLGTPFLTPNATSADQVGKRKAELLENNKTLSPKMRKVYTETIPNFVKNVLTEMDKGAAGDKKIFKGDELTDYGKFVTRLITPELTKFAIVKGLFNTPAKDTKLINGRLNMVSESLSQKGIQATGIDWDTPDSKTQADKIAAAINSNTSDLSKAYTQQFAKAYTARFEKTNEKTFKLAQAVIEKSGAGLNWRFDAAKDIADLPKAKSNKDAYSFETAINDMASFWKPFIANIKSENANALSICEVTDFWDGAYAQWAGKKEDNSGFNKMDNFGKYNDPVTAEEMLCQIIGATTTSNYSHFFNLYPEAYGANIEHGTNGDWGGGLSGRLYDAFMKGEDGVETRAFLKNGQLASLINTHIFVDNHDKPRFLHLAAIDDIRLFLQDTKGIKGKKYEDGEYKAAIESVIKESIDDVTKISPKGIAVAQTYQRVFEEHYGKSNIPKGISDAIIDLAKGSGITGSGYNEAKSRAFGARPFEITIKDIFARAEHNGHKIADAETVEKQVLENLLKKPMENFANIWETMVATVGVPTMYNGEEYGQTGHETSSKNQELGCRGIVMHSRKDDGSEFSKFYKQIDAASGLHKEEGLSALSGGYPTALKQGKDNDMVTSIYKYDSKGSEVLTAIAGINKKKGTKIDLEKEAAVKVEGIELLTKPEDKNKLTGLQSGDEFRRKKYDAASGKYIDYTEKYKVSDDGKSLVSADGKDIVLTPGANIFYRTTKGGVPIAFKGLGHAQANLHNTKFNINVAAQYANA